MLWGHRLLKLACKRGVNAYYVTAHIQNYRFTVSSSCKSIEFLFSYCTLRVNTFKGDIASMWDHCCWCLGAFGSVAVEHPQESHCPCPSISPWWCPSRTPSSRWRRTRWSSWCPTAAGCWCPWQTQCSCHWCCCHCTLCSGPPSPTSRRSAPKGSTACIAPATPPTFYLVFKLSDFHLSNFQKACFGVNIFATHQTYLRSGFTFCTILCAHGS